MIELKIPQKQIEKLRQLGKVGENNLFCFLGFTFNLQTKELHDVLQENALVKTLEVKDPTMHQQITELLYKYAHANRKERTGKLVKFKNFPGGYAYENAFNRRAAKPIAKVFGSCPNDLGEAAKLIGGKLLGHGESSVEVTALEGIPITYILWTDEELPPSANILFDETASNYLNVEDLSGLTELATWRLTFAKTLLKKI